MENLVKPSMIIVNENKLYVLEKTTISIYSLKNLELITTFGKSGEGMEKKVVPYKYFSKYAA